MHKTKIYKIDPITLKIVSTYDSIHDAIVDCVGKYIKTGTIDNVLNGRHCKAYGHYWCRAKDYNANWKPKAYAPNTSISKKICKIDKETLEVLCVYNSIMDISRINNIKYNVLHIGEVCKGTRKSAHGYYWCYEDNKDEYINNKKNSR